MKKNDQGEIDLSIRSVAKRTSLFGFFGLFPTMLVWIQSEELGASFVSVYASLLLTLVFIAAPIPFALLKKDQPTLVSTYGWLTVISFISIIFCFCGAQLFFYFIFAPIPLGLRVCGLTLVIGSGAIWAALCWHDHLRASAKSGLLNSPAYAEYSDHLVYDHFKAGDILNNHLHLRNPFSRPYLAVFLIIAPFGAFFYRFFGDRIGHHGMIWVLGFLTYPLYLFFIGAIVQMYRQTILMPRVLSQRTGKPIYWLG